jgi:predicted secreted hydrolase
MDAVSPAIAAGGPEEGWANQQIWMGHAAVTRADTHRVSQTFARGGVGQAGVDAKPFRAWIDAWEMRGLDPVNDDNIAPCELKASGADFSYALRLDAERPLVLQGDGGYSRKSLREQSYYTASRIIRRRHPHIDDKTCRRHRDGLARSQWSGQRWPRIKRMGLALAHFNSGDKLMLYRMRQATASITAPANRSRHGKTELLASADITMTPLTTPRSRNEKSRQHGVCHSEDGALGRCTPLNAKLDGHQPCGSPIRFAGGHTGVGYLMTGY